jgi:hypothetical protein
MRLLLGVAKQILLVNLHLIFYIYSRMLMGLNN